MTADSTEPIRMPSLAQLINAGSTLPKARVAMKIDIVKPIPHRIPTAMICLQVVPSRQRGPLQLQRQPAEQADPQRLADKQPGHNAQRQKRRQSGQGDSCSETPALAKANSGRIINATHGCRTCSSALAGDLPCFSSSGIIKPTITPARVA